MKNKGKDDPVVRNNKNINVNDIIDDIKGVLGEHDNPKEVLEKYLEDVESKIDTERILKLHQLNRKKIKELIKRHPYFKNPNDYGIRLVSIMKYLKKKGIDTTINDIDLFIDEIIKSCEGVKVIEFGKYKKIK